jgi:pyridoxamine-phosphate oxidase
MKNKKLPDLRTFYKKDVLNKKDLKKKPLQQFQQWFDEWLLLGSIDSNAMVLSTATKKGKPSSRTVLLKGLNDKGFLFYTNYESRKGNEIAENPYGCLLFYWNALERQVIVEGKIEKISRAESQKYFHSRPFEHQLGALISPQSEVIPDREFLDETFDELKIELAGQKIPLPDYWGGYRLVPETYIFWQGRESRLHDRFRYRKVKGQWIIERLAP